MLELANHLYTPSNEDYLVTEDTFETTLMQIEKASQVVVDVETDGLEPWKGTRLCGVGVAVSPELGYYFPFRHPTSNLPLVYLQRLWDVLKCVPKLAGYNLKFDLATMYQDGFDLPSEQAVADIIVAARLCAIEKYASLSLADQLEEIFGEEARVYDDAFKAYLKQHKWHKTYHLAPAEKVGAYCVGDVLNTWKLWDYYEEYIRQTKQTKVWKQEQAITYILWKMERDGFGYDAGYGKQKIPQLQARINNLYNEIWALAGRQFNLNSPPQLSEVMEELNIKPVAWSPKTKNPSWAVGALLTINHPIAGKIVEMRGLEKVLGTYFNPIMDWPNSTIHCQHKNWGTITGRLSCVEPNLQNIAKNVQNLQGNQVDSEHVAVVAAFLGAGKSGEFTQMAKGQSGVTMGGMMALASKYESDVGSQVSVRRLFIAREGYRLYMFDYKQMEMRILADYSNDPELLYQLESVGADFHSIVAKNVWTVDEESDLWNFYRTLAKAINFGMVYGIGIKKLAAQMQSTLKEAEQYKSTYFQRFPLIEQFIEAVIERIVQRGYIFNRFKRRYYIDPRRAYIGVNYLVQGTAAEIVKKCMIDIYRYLTIRGLKSRMLTQVHDELVFEIAEEEESWLPWKIKELMQAKIIKVMLPVEMAGGSPSWAQKEPWLDDENRWAGDIITG